MDVAFAGSDDDQVDWLARGGGPATCFEAASVVPTQPAAADGAPGYSLDVDLADLDADGDLDLAVALSGEGVKVHRWDAVTSSWAAASHHPVPGCRTLAFGDVDGDGDPDLVVGRDGSPALGILLNEAGILAAEPTWLEGSGGDPVTALAWGDVDGDGDLDLAVGADSGAGALWENGDGWLTLLGPLPGSPSPGIPISSLTWGDVDEDGDPDLVRVIEYDTAELLRNTRQAVASRTSNPTVVSVAGPSRRVSEAGALGSPWDTEAEPLIPVTITLRDAEDDPAARVDLQWSPGPGSAFRAATLHEDDVLVDLAAPREGQPHPLRWNAEQDGAVGRGVRLRARVVVQHHRRIVHPIQKGATWGVSAPFPVGSCRGEDADGDGFTCFEECHDGDEAVYPGAPEICDGQDNDCVDGVPAVEADLDGDGYLGCLDDCDDGDASVHPGAEETCESGDRDCDGAPPFPDVDGDGYSPCVDDCDDTDAAAHPGAAEVCADGVDQDCDRSEAGDRDDPDCWDPGCACADAGRGDGRAFAWLLVPLLLRRRRGRLALPTLAAALLLVAPRLATAAEFDASRAADQVAQALARGECHAAEETARRLCESLPTQPLGWRLAGDAARCRGDSRAAVAAYLAAIERGAAGATLRPVIEFLGAGLGTLAVAVPADAPLAPTLSLQVAGETLEAPLEGGVARFEFLPVGESGTLHLGGLGFGPQQVPSPPLQAGLVEQLSVQPEWLGVGTIRVADEPIGACTASVVAPGGIRQVVAGDRVEVTAGPVRARVTCGEALKEVGLEVADRQLLVFSPARHRPAQLTIVGLPAGSRVRLFVEEAEGTDADHVFDLPKQGDLDEQTGVLLAPPQRLGHLGGGVAGLFVTHPVLGTGTATVVVLGGEANATTFDVQQMDGLERVRGNHEVWTQRRLQALRSQAGAISLGGAGAALLSVAAGLLVASRVADADVAEAFEAGQTASHDPGCGGCSALDQAWSQSVQATRRREALRVAGAVSAGLGGLGVSISIQLQGSSARQLAKLGEWDMTWQP